MRYLVSMQCQLCIKTVYQNLFYRIVRGVHSLSSEGVSQGGWGHQNAAPCQVSWFLFCKWGVLLLLLCTSDISAV